MRYAQGGGLPLPGLIEGCLAGTGLTLDQTENPTDIMN
jgi:hypothetical protein